jgi:hypothetical protein
LKELIDRDAKYASGYIKNNNVKNQGNSGYFGYKKSETDSVGYDADTIKEAEKMGFTVYKVDLTDPDVIKKINEVQNAG